MNIDEYNAMRQRAEAAERERDVSGAPESLDDYVSRCRATRSTRVGHLSQAQHAVCALAEINDGLRDRIAALKAHLAQRDAAIRAAMAKE